jgi:hypothetical protein
MEGTHLTSKQTGARVELQLIGCAKGGDRKRNETAHIAAGFGGLASLVHLQPFLVQQVSSLVVKARPDRRGYRNSP